MKCNFDILRIFSHITEYITHSKFLLTLCQNVVWGPTSLQIKHFITVPFSLLTSMVELCNYGQLLAKLRIPHCDQNMSQ